VAWALLIAVFVVAAASLPFVLLAPRQLRPPGDVTSIAGLEAYLGKLVAAETPPALVVTVIRDGVSTYSRAFGASDASGTDANVGQVFHFWSVTKLFTATAVLQFAEDGELALDDPVAAYLPAFATTFAGKPVPITIRQLLDHTSGMKDLRPADLLGWIHHAGEPPVSETDIVATRMAAYRKLARPPGTASSYSNAGYIVLGAIIEQVSGQAYADVIRQRILAPLRMGRADFVYRDDMAPIAAAGSHPLFHFFTPLLLVMHRDWFSAWVTRTARMRMWLAPIHTDYTAPTGLIGTASDLARFGQAFLAGGEIDGARILRRESVRAMLEEGFGGNSGPDGDRMGLGWHSWDNAPLPFLGHGGEGPGFGAQLAIFPRRKMVVVTLGNDTLIDRVGLTGLVAKVFQ
jgi:CubicO group peptidase (beta-lactamase class C family)